MALGSIYDTILRCINTEKTTTELANGKYYFEVAKNATKESVKQAVEKIFEVNVEKVNISNRQGKVKRFKGKEGKRKAIKIAVVTVKKGQDIKFDKLG